MVCAAGPGTPLIQNFPTTDSGRDSSGTWTVRQGPDNVMYFGSDGLLTFDGSRWQQFPMNGAYALRGLDFGKGNKIWAGAVGEIGWYAQESTGAWTYHS